MMFISIHIICLRVSALANPQKQRTALKRQGAMVTVTRDSVDATISVLLFMKAFSAGARRWFAQKWGGSDLMLVRKERI